MTVRHQPELGGVRQISQGDRGRLSDEGTRRLVKRWRWGSPFPADTGIPDRFLYHVGIIKITGHSYRLKDRAIPQDVIDKESKE